MFQTGQSIKPEDGTALRVTKSSHLEIL